MDRPNIILIMPDQQRADSLGCYGNCFTRTPHVDRLAREGVRFDRAFTVWPVCTPARGTMWTGVYPHAHGLIENVYGVDDAIATRALVKTTVFDLLKRAGYRTAHFGKWHLGEVKPPFFDVWEASFNSRVGHWVGAWEESQYRPDLQTDRCIQFLHQHKAGDPPFMMVQGYYPPHDPFSAPKRFYEPYRGKGVPFAGYYAAVSALDEDVGRIMEALDATGLTDNTVVIYYSDHGETFFYREDGEHKFVCFDEAILVPMIIRWPARLAAGRVVAQPVGLQDLVPTVLDCAEAPLPPTLHGRSILPLAEGERVEWRDYAYVENITHKRKRVQRCYRTEQWKLIGAPDGEHSLFDLQADPEEELDVFLTPRQEVMNRYNHFPDYAPVIARLAEGLRQAAAQIDDETGSLIADSVLAVIGKRLG